MRFIRFPFLASILRIYQDFILLDVDFLTWSKMKDKICD